MRIPDAPPGIDALLAGSDVQQLTAILTLGSPVDQRGRYLHWDDLRWRTPPAGLSHEAWWAGTQFARNAIRRDLPLRSGNGEAFGFVNIDTVQAAVHFIDQQPSGHLLTDRLVTNRPSSDRYLVTSLIEEAITSSQLEGASTTRRVAKEMLVTGRRPRDRSEQMIANNYAAVLLALEMAAEPLTPAMVLDLHRVVTADTLDDPADTGRLQRPGDDRIRVEWRDGQLLHQPPAAEELPARLDALCRFANDPAPGGFLHPVVKAIVIHFWVGHDHPFVDGNGRTARALFYWSLLRDGYWLAQYLSISSVLRKAPAKYARAYLLSETDENDLTYFVIYQLEVLRRAIDFLKAYLDRKATESRELEVMLRRAERLNQRQQLILQDALRDAEQPFTIAAQSRRYRVTYQTARTDLLGLASLGLMTKQRVGRKFVFRAVPDLAGQVRGCRVT